MRRALLALVLLTSSVQAKKLTMTKEHKLSLALRDKSPTFYAFYPTLLVDEGRFLGIGRGILAEQGRFDFLDLAKLKQKSVSLDVDAWFAAHTSDFPRTGKGPLDTGSVEGLLFFDSSRKTIGIEVRTADRRATYLLVGDTKSGKVTHQHLLGRNDAGDQVTSAVPLHYADGKLYLLVSTTALNDGKTVGIVMRLADGKLSEVARYKSPNGSLHTTALDLPRHRVFLPRYAEFNGSVTTSTGVIIDLETGAVQELTIPTTTYGAVFSDDGAQLFTFSSDTGMLWKIDVASGEKLGELKMGKYGFPVGFFAPNRLAVLRNSTLTEVDAVKMKKLTTLQLKTLAKGFWHTEGSHFIGSTGRVVVRNGNDLFIVRLSDK